MRKLASAGTLCGSSPAASVVRASMKTPPVDATVAPGAAVGAAAGASVGAAAGASVGAAGASVGAAAGAAAVATAAASGGDVGAVAGAVVAGGEEHACMSGIAAANAASPTTKRRRVTGVCHAWD